MSVGVMKDYKVKLRNLRSSHTLGDVEVIGALSTLRLIRKPAALAKIKLTCDLSIEEKAARRKWKNPPLVDCES